jgi:hypothetical protein
MTTNRPDLVQAFLKEWWVNQILKRQTSRSHYGSKVSAVTKTVFKYRNKIGKIVVKASWEAFLDLSDFYYLFADLVGFYTH